MSNQSSNIVTVQAYHRTGTGGNDYGTLNVANLFNSGQPTPNPDPNQIEDLLTPNKMYLTSGSPYGGVSTDGGGATNNEALGHTLIIKRKLNSSLASYNEGKIGPGHCDD